MREKSRALNASEKSRGQNVSANVEGQKPKCVCKTKCVNSVCEIERQKHGHDRVLLVRAASRASKAAQKVAGILAEKEPQIASPKVEPNYLRHFDARPKSQPRATSRKNGEC